jgi:hypothetical protein
MVSLCGLWSRKNNDVCSLQAGCSKKSGYAAGDILHLTCPIVQQKQGLQVGRGNVALHVFLDHACHCEVITL